MKLTKIIPSMKQLRTISSSLRHLFSSLTTMTSLMTLTWLVQRKTKAFELRQCRLCRGHSYEQNRNPDFAVWERLYCAVWACIKRLHKIVKKLPLPLVLKMSALPYPCSYGHIIIFEKSLLLQQKFGRPHLQNPSYLPAINNPSLLTAYVFYGQPLWNISTAYGTVHKRKI